MQNNQQSNQDTLPRKNSSIFSFDGRIRRKQYIITSIVLVSLSKCLDFLLDIYIDPLVLVFYMLSLWATIAVGAKRCHDLGKSGWWQFIPFYYLWLVFQDGQPGENEYGQNPKSK